MAYEINDILDEATERQEQKKYTSQSKWRSRKAYDEDDVDFL